MRIGINIETNGLLSEDINCRITCIGIKPFGSEVVQFHGEDEKKILTEFMKDIKDCKKLEFYGWNNIEFDDRFILFRCFVQNVDARPFLAGRNYTLDLLKMFAGYKTKGFKQDSVASTIGLEQNGCTGKDCVEHFEKREGDKLLKKNEIDLVQLEEIVKRCIDIGLVVTDV